MVLLVARLLLAGVFAVAAIGKLTRRSSTGNSLVAFGIPPRFARSAGITLPLTELLLASALLLPFTAWAGAAGALALLVLFDVVIAVTLAHGRKPDCHCFGGLRAHPVGPFTLVRNAVLAVLAGLIVVQGPGAVMRGELLRPFAWLTPLRAWATILTVPLVASVIANSLLIVQLRRRTSELLSRLDALEGRLPADRPVIDGFRYPRTGSGLAVGAAAPAFSLADTDGHTLTLDALLSTGRPVLLVFLDTACSACNALLPDVGRWQRQLAPTAILAIISRGRVRDNRAYSVQYQLSHVLLQLDYEVAHAYDIPATPAAVLVLPDGRIGSPTAAGAAEIRSLVRAGVPGQGSGRPSVRVGELAPVIRLRDLDGSPVRLSDFAGQQVLLLFWDSRCRFCQALLPDLAAWDTNPGADAPRLLVVLTGSAPQVAVPGISAGTLVDSDFAARDAFAIGSTPTAVLLDAEGTLTAGPAYGVSAVRAMLRPRPAVTIPAP